MNRSISLLCLCGLLALPLSHAQDAAQPEAAEEPLKLYDVEIVIFRNVNVPRGHEYNLPTPLIRKPDSSLDLFDPQSIEKGQELGFTPLLSEEMRLHETVQQLTRSSRYALLLHTGWRQPGLEEGQSLPVWIRGGELYDEGYQSIDQMMFRPQAETQTDGTLAEQDPVQTPQVASQSGALPTPLQEDMPDQSGQSPQTTANLVPVHGLYELEGQITIVLSRYLHTHANLVLRKPAGDGSVTPTSGDAANSSYKPMRGNLLLNYALNEKRRMRSKRLHYLDHPQFGMLVLITPYTPPPEPASTLETGTQPPTQLVAPANGT